MTDFTELHQKTISLLSQRPNNKNIEVVPTDDIEHLGIESEKFCVFVPAHLEYALEIAAKFMNIAKEVPGEEGLERVLEEAAFLAETENNEAVKYALKVFITHSPEGNVLPIPPLEVRAPQDVLPSQEVLPVGVDALGALGAEAVLDYFREDTWFNEHHEKWHVVYPFRGVPNPADPNGPFILRPRQGELFWYMHQQMLARYDAERSSFGLGKTIPFSDFSSPLEGYDANLDGFGNRLPDQVLHDVDFGNFVYTVDKHREYRDKLLAVARAGAFEDGTPIPETDPSVLANTFEANRGAVKSADYGNLHNFGHVLIADLDSATGVMASTSTAVRDPVFYRWHRQIDDIQFEWQETLSPNDFSDAPNVSLRKELNGENNPDILLSLSKDIAGAGSPGFDAGAYGEQHFGGANWEAPLSSLPALTDELRTTMKVQTIVDDNGNNVDKNYLDFEDFVYIFRLENNDGQSRNVTARVFLADSAQSHDRRHWIEMDKFPVKLTANEKKVVVRSSRLSSVVRKPAYHPSENRPVPPIGTPNDNYCDCGWPYNLLLPRGTEEGMDFKLFVMLTDWQIDSVGAEKKCGSMSFCGAKDTEYPDKRAMGYPFDRPFSRSFDQIVAGQTNMAVRDLKIKFIAGP